MLIPLAQCVNLIYLWSQSGYANRRGLFVKKFMNNIEGMLVESLRGFAAAHVDLVRIHENPHFITRRHVPVEGKVALVSGGGSGHEPLHLGYVGRGMLDAACPGEVFTSPTPDQMLAASEAVNGGKGILFIVKNYAGDRMNFEMAAEMLEIEHETLLITDEALLTEPPSPEARRGMAGTMIVHKMVGAAAETGADLKGCKVLGERVNRATRTMGVALTSCMLPAANQPTFELGEDEMELGVGIHGEPGRKRLPLMKTDDLIEWIIDTICRDLGLKSGDRLLLLVNGLGCTPLIEQYLIFHAAEKTCRGKGLEIARSLVGNYTTSLEMAGCSITLCRLDDELIRLWDAPVHTVSLRWGY